MSESVPSSITGFANRRIRTDSVASFTYFEEPQESVLLDENEVITDQSDEDDDPLVSPEADDDGDLEAGHVSMRRRKSSGFSRLSVEDPLLYRHDSTKSNTSVYGSAGRTSQKIRIMTEDLTIVIAGFNSSYSGLAGYIALCVCTFGLGYLLFRWLPRWHVRLVGSQRPLQECSWVVIEVSFERPVHRKLSAYLGQNQWGEFTTHRVQVEQYGHSVSTVFGSQEKIKSREYDDEEDDPVVAALRFLDYRYIRFIFHPLKDKFVLNSSWKDPTWTNVKSIKAGLDTDERLKREKVFGMNIIDIEQKSVPQLLIDEVRFILLFSLSYILIISGLPSILRISGCQSHFMVTRRVLLLRSVYILDLDH